MKDNVNRNDCWGGRNFSKSFDFRHLAKTLSLALRALKASRIARKTRKTYSILKIIPTKVGLHTKVVCKHIIRLFPNFLVKLS